MDGLIELLPMTRRSFIGSVIALAAAPAIVRAERFDQVGSVLFRKPYRFEIGSNA